MQDVAETVLAQLSATAREVLFRTRPYCVSCPFTDHESYHATRVRRSSACRTFLVETCDLRCVLDYDGDLTVESECTWRGVAAFARAAPAVRLMMLLWRRARGDPGAIGCWIDGQFVAHYDAAEDVAEALEAIVL